MVLVHLPLEWNTYLLFNSDIANFVWNTDESGREREPESIVLLIFVLWPCFNRHFVRGSVVGQKVLFRAFLLSLFPARI